MLALTQHFGYCRQFFIGKISVAIEPDAVRAGIARHLQSLLKIIQRTITVSQRVDRRFTRGGLCLADFSHLCVQAARVRFIRFRVTPGVLVQPIARVRQVKQANDGSQETLGIQPRIGGGKLIGVEANPSANKTDRSAEQ